jgi:hypothetical protein
MTGAASVGYVGNGPYCYANSTAMLLAATGEQVSPGLIEVLSGVGLGATWLPDSEVFFLSMAAPDVGIGRALGLLGFDVMERAHRDDDAAPFDELGTALAQGPAVLGPLDMGLLTYVAGRGTATGADHFVLVYGLDEAEAHLHDPAGQPHVSISRTDLEKAWRAELVEYRRGAYRWWTNPRRVRRPSEAELVQTALAAFREIYREAETAPAPGVERGSAAIRLLAGRTRDGLPQKVARHLVAFVFQLGARRALDYAAFLQEGPGALARIEREQAALLGRCHTLAVRQDCPELVGALHRLADTEDRFRDALLAG